MILLFTDFGAPYVGQMKAEILSRLPAVAVVEICTDLPPYDVEAAAHLLAAHAEKLPVEALFLCVVDPGVGGARRPVAVQAAGRWFVGPDNGLFDVITRRAQPRAGDVFWFEIVWRPLRLSTSFHGRDLFAPMAVFLKERNAHKATHKAKGLLRPIPIPAPRVVLEDRPRILYIDSFGNAVTGLRAAGIPDQAIIRVGGWSLSRADTFSAVSAGAAFWYENSLGLVEIAINRGDAADKLGMRRGDPVALAA